MERFHDSLDSKIGRFGSRYIVSSDLIEASDSFAYTKVINIFLTPNILGYFFSQDMEQIISFETTKFDLDFINHVKEIRKTKKLSKDNLSLAMGLAKSFVSNVESLTQRHKYLTRHIALLAKAFQFNNISELMKFPTPEYDKIRVTVKQTMNEDNSKVIKSEIIGVEPIK